jgi:uroporphyrinogen-III synthase
MQVGLKTTGDACGNAKMLATTILKYFADKDIPSVDPLLFPCGNLARDTLPSELESVGLKVTRVVCYNTLRHPGIEESLKTLSHCKVFGSQCCIVFFSPSGVEFVLPFLTAYCDIKITKVIAIGPTTATSLKQVGIFPIMAHAPTPEALLVAVHQCFL